MPARNKPATTKKVPAVRKKRVVKKKGSPAKFPTNNAGEKADAGRQSSTQHTVTLDSVVVINNARSLYEEFAKAIYTDVNIDASAVEMIDTAILQLLYAFVIKVTSTNHKINWINPSDEFISRTKLLGLSRNMGIA